MRGRHTIRETSPELRQRAKELRKRMTSAERTLWSRLRGHQLGGLKIRRQHPLGRFIVDFYCTDARLVLEVDGGIHDRLVERDAARTEYLEQRGFGVIRIRNEDIEQNLEKVLAEILAVCEERMSPPPPSQ